MRALADAEPWLRLARRQVETNQLGVLPPQGIPPQPALPAALPAAQPNVIIPMDIEEWWHSMRANPLADPLSISQQFLTCVQWDEPLGSPDPEDDWLQLPGPPGQGKTWEHATWITASDLTDGMLRDAVRTDGYVLDDRSWSAVERVRTVAQTEGDFVALLGPGRRFERLVDRRSLLEELGKAAIKP